jgi:transcriptional regulator with XRE-family HTH domain
MKQILLDLRQWLGLSQSEMAKALGIKRSWYAMAEIGKRSLEPNAIFLVLALHNHMRHAPENEETRTIEKTVLQDFLTLAEEDLKLLNLERTKRERNAKFKEGFPERTLLRPVPATEGLDAEEALDAMVEMASGRMHRYAGAFTKTLKEELKLVSAEAIANHLRTRLA